MTTLSRYISGVDHLALQVTDLDAAQHFFSEILGFRLRLEINFEEHHILQFQAGKIDLEVWRTSAHSDDSTQIMHHLGLTVRDLDAAMRAARAEGVRVITDIYSPTKGIREAILEGPDKLRIQLVEQNLPLLIWRSIRGDFK